MKAIDIHKARGKRAGHRVRNILERRWGKNGRDEDLIIAAEQRIAQDVEKESRKQERSRRKRAEKHRLNLDFFDE